MTKTALLVYGSGGHNEEMIRLHSQLNEILNRQKQNLHFISLCDDDVRHYVSADVIIVPSITDKFSYIKLFMKIPIAVLNTFRTLRELTKNHTIDYVITTGPGVGVICGVFFKLKKTKVISIENSSRFYSKSLTGRAMHYLADFFIVQNEELLELYDKAIYKGRL